MVKFFHLFRNYYFGISFAGIIAFVIQEIPYMIMPLINMKSNPIMNMPNEIPWIEKTQSVFGVLSMILLMLIVKENDKFFSVATYKEKAFFTMTVLMILINFTGWAFYYLGFQYGWLIVISQFAVVPLYYLFFGLWKSNYLLVGTASVFFIIHTVNGCLNFLF
ncbi:MAG: hypothetical protein NC432_00260 [Roseburia sp.]|nr:hypothetical protein [Roseburia sp.]MCM1099006.1 hypothetical protein [Ruminococcus flavefaciens]